METIKDGMMDFQDISIKCASCGREFIFTAREQEFFYKKDFKEPRHCRECRQKRKQERERGAGHITEQTERSGRVMFQVTCGECGRETMVPFKPTTGKPVLCKDCFIAHRYGTRPPVKVSESDSIKEVAEKEKQDLPAELPKPEPSTTINDKPQPPENSSAADV